MTSDETGAPDEAPAPVTPLAANATKRSAAASEEAATGSGDGAESPGRTGGAEIVSLDKFRKK